MEVRRAFGGREDIGQMVYSDGLASISIFIEPAAPQDAAEGDASKGPVNVVTKRHGDFWLTDRRRRAGGVGPPDERVDRLPSPNNSGDHGAVSAPLLLAS